MALMFQEHRAQVLASGSLRARHRPRKIYWVEAMEYTSIAYRFLLTERSVSSRLAVPYNPTADDGPLLFAGGKCSPIRSSASLSCRSAASRTGVPSSSVTRAVFKWATLGGPGRPRGVPDRPRADLSQLIMDAATETGFIKKDEKTGEPIGTALGHLKWAAIFKSGRSDAGSPVTHAACPGEPRLFLSFSNMLVACVDAWS
jgi:hypothetical protein